MTLDRNRRTFLKASGAALSLTLVAGCSSGDGGDGGDGDDGGSGNSEVDDWLSDTSNYDSVEDFTGESEVTVEVGADDGFTFAPPAITVDSGTTVVWEWTGEGGGHDVVDEDGAFESEQMSDEGETFEHTFDETGTFLYKCNPHESMGMKGAVIVE